MNEQRYYLPAMGVACALGNTAAEVCQGLFNGDQSGMQFSDQYTPSRPLPLGRVSAQLGELHQLPHAHRSRNNLLLLHVLQQIEQPLEKLMSRYGRKRIGVVLGTSTSGIAEGEAAIAYHKQHGDLPAEFHYSQQEIGSPSQFLRQHLQLGGPALTLSTACSSSAKAFASARRLIRVGMCDAVIVGGVDTLCGLTVNGFSALEAVSEQLCNPFSRNRNGINIGEGAALFLLSHDESDIRLGGIGESSDAYHFSAPQPEGLGAEAAMRVALQDAQLDAAAIGYLNLHGTATPHNDSMEGKAVARLLGTALPCSSSKPLIGHTLGAAGAIESAFCWLTLQGDGQLPAHCWDGQRDETIPALRLVSPQQYSNNLRHVMSNSFAFGGSNVSVILSHD